MREDLIGKLVRDALKNKKTKKDQNRQPGVWTAMLTQIKSKHDDLTNFLC